MARKITLTNLRSGFNTGQIQDNFDKIETALNDKVLWRNMTGLSDDNSVRTPVDMNSQRMVNLPPPLSGTEPLRLGDVSGILDAAGQAEQHAELARQRAESASQSATAASAAASSASFQAGLAGDFANDSAEEADRAALFAAAAANNSRLTIGTVDTGLPSEPAEAEIVGPAGFQQLNLTLPQGVQGITGDTGPTGVGITSVTRTDGNGAAGTVDTYTILFSDSTTTTFQITNGTDGRAIVSVNRTSGDGSPGTSDTYTITFSDATTSTFQVYNGADGTGTGDVNGPANSTDGALAVYSGNTGKLLADSGTTLTSILNSIGTKAPLNGVGTSGTWPISITGSAASAASATYSNSANGPWVSAKVASTSSDDTYSAVITSPVGGSGDTSLASLGFLNGSSYGIKLSLRADGYFGLGGWSSSPWRWYVTSTGDMVSAGNVTAYSDPRLKENFERITDPHRILHQITGNTFTWRNGIPHTACKAGKRDYGLRADEIEAVMPEVVTRSIEIDGQSYLTVAYEKLVPVLVEAIKNLDNRVKELEGKNDAS